jgi:endonuclease-3
MEELHEELKRRAAEICGILESLFGEPEWPGPSEPLDSLVKTLLSQNTNDKNRDSAYQQLVKRFPTWVDVMNASPPEVAEAIRPAGLANQKSQRLVAILRWVNRKYGRLSLEVLHRMPTERAFQTFTKLKGIGLKTMAVVLMFACGRDVFPVDTHVYRITRRLGLLPSTADAVMAFRLMAPLVPPGKAFSLHMNLLRFGRTVCKAHRPKCPGCPLYGLCVWPDKPAL